ncbi:MAG: hypothetical protein HYZ00_01765, partial [Candidatus Hydrogenedentes bacterium]|nr:hypothetical protein [Candidatus Hydrogenedentota bacterium]
EENWVGPILDNHRISQTLEQWKALWNARDTAQDPNWRLQMYLMRAYYDAYVQEKAQKERAQEATANEELARATEVGPKAAIAAARATLADTTLSPKAQEYRKEIEGLAAALLKSIGFQFSIKPPYRARNAERGALLDTLDQPLNNRLWLETQFVAILELPSEAEQEARVLQLATWEQPGEGSFYDDLGNLAKQPHLVRQKTWDEDPGGVGSAMVEFQMAMKSDTLELSTQRLSWLDQAKTLYGAPLLMRYEGLDPSATYRLRVTYAGRYNATMTLTADGTHQIHGPLPQPNPVAPQEFEIPAAATADGVLDLSWALVKGRGCQLAEVWLLKQK